MPSAATGSKLKQATLGTNSLQTQNTHWQTPHPQLWMRKWGCRQAGRPARGSIRWQLLWKTNRKKSVPGNANQSSKEQPKHTLLLRVAPSSITISSQQGCTCMWTTSQHKCQLPGYDLYSRPHPNWSVPSLPLTHLLKPQHLPSKLPKQTKFLAGSGPDHWHPPAFSYS